MVGSTLVSDEAAVLVIARRGMRLGEKLEEMDDHGQKSDSGG
ncbi:MAG: hypothetical protein RIE73_23815 [Coleofasciculus sp. C1-SOL-03]